MSWLPSAVALLLALLIDRHLGEPPVRLHPVVLMGNYLNWAGRRLQRLTQPVGVPDLKAFWLAVLYWCAGATIVLVVSWGLVHAVLWLALVGAGLYTGAAGLADSLSMLLSAVLLALLLKPMLAWAMLTAEVRAVELALAQSLEAGRERLSWLVSRDTACLSESQVRESAIESLAENLNDSVVAPIFWFVLLGLPGAAVYRFANTADAMWGYKDVYKGQNWEWAGKWAARVDDVLNWVPARLTGALLALLCHLPLRQLRHEAGKTPSPNSGWPMAAMALALGITLGKPGVYTLNPGGRAPQAADTSQALIYASKVLVVLVVAELLAMYLISLLKNMWP